MPGCLATALINICCTLSDILPLSYFNHQCDRGSDSIDLGGISHPPYITEERDRLYLVLVPCIHLMLFVHVV